MKLIYACSSLSRQKLCACGNWMTSQGIKKVGGALSLFCKLKIKWLREGGEHPSKDAIEKKTKHTL